MQDRETQYTVDILAALAKHTITRLWVIIILLICMICACFVSLAMMNKSRNDAIAAKIDALNELRELESSIETVYEYEVEQEADDYGRNYVVSGDFYGETKSPSEENDPAQDGR